MHFYFLNKHIKNTNANHLIISYYSITSFFIPKINIKKFSIITHEIKTTADFLVFHSKMKGIGATPLKSE